MKGKSLARYTSVSTGHGCWPPTTVTQDLSSTVFVNGFAAGKVGMKFIAHECHDEVHSDEERMVTAGSGTVFIEGKSAARIGDPIACGDTVGEGSPNVFVGG